MSDGEDRAADAAATRPDGRLPYETPAVTWEQPLETHPSLMSGCQKLPAQSVDCGTGGPSNS